MRDLAPMALLVALALLPACNACSSGSSGHAAPDSGTDTDADTDTDVDTDSDSDSDSDTDTDSDTDDTDTWPSGDTAPDGYGEVAEACWITTFGGPDWDLAFDVVALPDGSAIVLGHYMESITLGLGEAEETTLYETTGPSGFLARFDADGALVWARNIAVDADLVDMDFVSPDVIFVVGSFYNEAIFNLGEADEIALSGDGEIDICLARYDIDGGVEWARQDGGHEDVWASGVAALSGGTSVVMGTFAETATFGLGEEHETTLVTEEHGAIFMARYYPDGTLAWVRAECIEGGEVGCSPGPGIAVAEDESVYMASGWYRDGNVFGAGQPNETVMESHALEWSDWPGAEAGGIFMSAFDYSGILQWAVGAEANHVTGWLPWDRYTTAVTLTDGSYTVAGAFLRDLVFAYGEEDETFLHSPYDEEDYDWAMYVARITDSGDLVWALSSASGLWDGSALGKSTAALPDERLLVVGTFWGAVNFASDISDEAWLVSSSDVMEPFAAVYSDVGELEWLARLGSSWDSSHQVSVDALDDGTFLVSGAFKGSAEFLVGEDEYVTVTAPDEWEDGFLLHVCP